ncbi:hypothetical protein [Corynebacterium cystitidis]|uniref:hypothetical protein n=2 Tax=Corynebacterium cystitidis TaxID=35757 RepID=UPI00211E8CB7|nr:hypothetical protein [Corynebacterium cystitidis]
MNVPTANAPTFGVRHWGKRPSTWVCLGSIVVSLIPILQVPATGYVETIIAQSTMTLFVLAPGLASASAWEASRFRAWADKGPSVALKILIDRIVIWSLIVPLGYVCASVLQAFARGGMVGQPLTPSGVGMLLYVWIVGISWALIGATLGFSTRPIIAVITAGVLAYVWFAILPSTSPGPIRRITGDFLVCCSLDSVIDPQAIAVACAGSIGFACLVIAAALMWKREANLGAVVACVSVAGFGVATAGTSSIDQFGAAPRDPSVMECRDQVCAWPEIPDDAVDVNIQARQAFAQVIPEQWSYYLDVPVVWGELTPNQLSFSGESTVEGVLGNFGDQAGSAELAASDSEVCGLPASELGVTVSGLPWDPNQRVDRGIIHDRLEQALCLQAKP